MITIKAESTTAQMVQEDSFHGSHVVLLVARQGPHEVHTGQDWAVFQGTGEQCQALAENINTGLVRLTAWANEYGEDND